MHPTLSLCAISGDDHIHMLPRMVKSIVDRPGGPAASEIVLGWNGKDDEKLVAALLAIDPRAITVLPGLEVGDVSEVQLDGVVLRVHRQEWKSRFHLARQENFGYAKGEWRGYIDLDDRIALPGDPEVEDAREADMIPLGLRTAHVPFPPGTTLEQLLREQPETVNCILAPYHYILSEKRRALVRKRRPRIVRWDEHWAWVNPVHERLAHALTREIGVYEAGLVYVHDPDVSAVERRDRNFEILKTTVAEAEKDGAPLPGQLMFGLGTQHLERGDLDEAIKSFDLAAVRAVDPEERMHFQLYCARALLDAGLLMEAAARALEAIKALPDRPEGYLMASEIAVEMGTYPYAIKWYEAGGHRPLPPAVMIDDRMARLVSPVYSAGRAYLQTEQPEKALEVAERALKETEEPMAVAVRNAALARIKRRTASRKAAEAITEAIDLGLPGVAKRALDLYQPLMEKADSLPLAQRVEKILDQPPPSIPPTSIVTSWFSHARPEDVVVLTPVDAAVDPLAFTRDALLQAQENAAVWLCATDTLDLSPWSQKARAGIVSTEGLLAECEKHGIVDDLMLVEDEPGKEAAQFVVTKVTKRTVAPWTPDITFWCPIFMEPWGPWRIMEGGVGGSEESVIYLARELSNLGARVQVFAPLDARHRGVHVEGGVRWRSLPSMDFGHYLPGVVISHRAPNAIRTPCFDPKRLYVWHQDAWYHQGWSKDIASAVRNLWVSKWQREVLLLEAGLDEEAVTGGSEPDRLGLVCGDGIPLSCFDWRATPPERKPLECAYLSSPLRGLDRLLDVWPEALKAFPEARLNVYYGWYTTPTNVQREIRGRIMAKITKAGNVVWHGRRAQLELESILPTMGVWAYNCVTGGTRISMPCDHRRYPDGVPIQELVGKSGFPVWSFDEANGRFTLATVERVWETKKVTELVELDLDDGSTLRLTPDHQLLDFDGAWNEARVYKPGDRMMALHYRYNVMIKDFDGRWISESRKVGEWREGRELTSEEHVDHADATRLDNSPGRLTVLSASAHAVKTHAGRVRSASERKKQSEAVRKSWNEDGGARRKAARVFLTQAARKFWNGLNADPAARAEFLARRGVAQQNGINSITPEAKERQRLAQEQGRKTRWNHKVVAVRHVQLAHPESVYDMTVAKYHNFVANGVVAHNCLFAEGFCIAGIRATAAGMIPVYRKTAAMGEVQHPGPFAVEDKDWEDGGGREEYTAALLAGLKASVEGTFDREAASDWAKRYTWDKVAVSVLADIEGRNKGG